MKMFNATEEEKMASYYSHVRMMSVERAVSPYPQQDLHAIDLHWIKASKGSN